MWNGWRRGEAAAAAKAARRAWARVDLKAPHLPDLRRVHLPDLHAPEIDWGRGRMGSRAAALWPALFAAAGAGAAVWWWNQWARGQAEAQAAGAGPDPAAPPVEPSPEDRADGREGAAAPEAIMAHAPAPKPKAQPKRKGEGDVAILSDAVRDGLDEDLAVQASAKPPKPGKAKKPKPLDAKSPGA